MQLKRSNSDWACYAVDFPSTRATRYPEHRMVRGEYYQTLKANNSPLVILLHGFGDQILIPCKLLARSLVKQGYACFVLYSIFHSSRVPETVKSRLRQLTPEEWYEGYQISVADVRQVIDWANCRPEINGEQVAALGISFGGFITAIAMGVDERICSGIFIISGGNGEKIAKLSRKNTMRKTYNDIEYNNAQNSFRQYLAEVSEKGVENVVPPKKSFLTDPLTFAHNLKGRPLLMINSFWDEYIPREATLDFWEASGRPEIVWYPATHSTIWLWYPAISRKIANFLKSTFNNRR